MIVKKIFFINYLILITLFLIIISCREKENITGTTIIIPPKVDQTHLRINSPKYSEIWNYNSFKEIQWTVSSDAKSVAIDLYRKHTHKLSIAEETSDDGLFNWEVPSHLASSNLYRIKLTNLQNPSDTCYSPFFSIR